VTNGFWDDGPDEDQSRLFMNLGSGPDWFEDVSAATGFDDPYWGSALLALDLDRDGDLDLVQTCNGTGPQPSAIRVLENRPTGKATGRYLCVRPRMPGANHRAIGAVVRVVAGDLEMMRLITAGTSFLGQEPAEAFFGFGLREQADLVVVEWPGGGRTELTDVELDRVLTIELLAADIDRDGDVDVEDVLALLSSWGECPDPPARCAADVNGDGVVDTADLLVVLSSWS
jgi:hypothetical protein